MKPIRVGARVYFALREERIGIPKVYSFPSLALACGKSIRWLASELGHACPEFTLRVYAHALREEEADLSFLDFAGTKRPYTAHPEAPPSADRVSPRKKW